jgi:hypothetical protein
MKGFSQLFLYIHLTLILLFCLMALILLERFQTLAATLLKIQAVQKVTQCLE